MQKRIYIRTLGCDKNTADSSAFEGLVEQKGWSVTEELKNADWAVINTCGFILPAKKESIQTILEVVAAKQDNTGLKVIVHGCLSQKYEKELRESIPEVDAFFGVYSLTDILDYIESKEEKSELKHHDYLDSDEQYPRSTKGTTAYLKIADGCDTCCTYCAIPSIKGPFISRKQDILLKEAQELAKHGIKELILVAQDTTAYGKDLEDTTNLSLLLHELCQIEGLRWIRILYAYPDAIDEELLKTIQNEAKICNYLDIPLQHASDSILRKMGRKMTQEKIRNLIGMIRKQCPDITLRSTLITGFPQESEEEFAELMSFMKEIKLNWVGAFTYSQEDGTPAARMTGQIDEEIKQERYNQLMEMQQRITSEWLASWQGKTIEVLIEEKVQDELYMGRTRFMSPDVDGVISVKSDKKLYVGDFVQVFVQDSTEYDLIGEIRNEYI
ncbi:30S ribosomal protein S12 methylthiotransferase RimO [Clostridia bacterium]|nr:30S ribosomal protein S12 methylthiotransferase RimO [Clostridia bacterium]